MLRDLTKVNLTQESFRLAVFQILNSEVPGIAQEIIAAEEDSDMLNDCREEGLTVGETVKALINEYREFNGLDRKPIR